MPVTHSRLYHLAWRRFHDNFAKPQSLFEGTGSCKDTRVGANAHKRTQYLGRDCVRCFAVDHGKEPLAVSLVFNGVIAERADEDVNIRRNQRRPSIRSRRAAELPRSTPGRAPPPTGETGRSRRFRLWRFWELASSNRSPCSIIEVRVSPRSLAACFARRRRRSSSRIVVLICL